MTIIVVIFQVLLVVGFGLLWSKLIDELRLKVSPLAASTVDIVITLLLFAIAILINMMRG